MDSKSFYFLVLSVSMFVSICGEESRPHFCEALEANKNQIDFTVNVPQKTHFNNYIFINGHFWKVLFTPSAPPGDRRKRQDDEQTGDDPPDGGASEGDGGASGDDGGASGGDGGVSGGDGGSSNGTDGGNSSVTTPKESPVKLSDPYGIKFKETNFFEEKFKCAFGVRYRQTPKWTSNVIGGTTADFSKVRYIVTKIGSPPGSMEPGNTSGKGGESDEGSGEGDGGSGDEEKPGEGSGGEDKAPPDGGKEAPPEEDTESPDYIELPDEKPEGSDGRGQGADTRNSDSERRKRQPNETEPEPGPEKAPQPPPQTPSEPIVIKEFKTEFENSSFKPQLAFNSFSRMDSNSIVFIETTKSSDSEAKYKSRIQGFSLEDPALKWVNETGGNTQKPFRRRRQSERAGMLRKVPQSIWDIVGQYYVKGVFGVKLNDQQNGSIILIEICSSEDIPCSGTVTYKYCIVEDSEQHPYRDGGSCSPDKLQLIFDCSIDWRTTTLPPPLVPGATNPDGSPVTGGPSGDSDKPGDTGDTPKPEESKGGMAWLWILIILIIIIIIIIVIIFCFCCKKKNEKPKEGADGAGAAAGVAGPPSDTGKPPSGTGKPPSGTGSGGGGLEKSSSTMSTASTRSKVGSDSV